MMISLEWFEAQNEVIEKLTAENARLREALEAVRNFLPYELHIHHELNSADCEICNEERMVQKIVYAALEAAKGDE